MSRAAPMMLNYGLISDGVHDGFCLRSSPPCAVLVQSAPPSSRWWLSVCGRLLLSRLCHPWWWWWLRLCDNSDLLRSAGNNAFSSDSAVLNEFGKSDNTEFRPSNLLVGVLSVLWWWLCLFCIVVICSSAFPLHIMALYSLLL
ncbi:hypothetical protein L195_g004336 [Trifolium pratense]|uniref:Uncharacterized protein n=1 Tax=Trifolium pratense TaxID=57577 RepID=A0A2K3NXS0_TRIPR|nr:hypothetical protein L195_g004336 [Trifolium pratense]